jgi:hypothetical protein
MNDHLIEYETFNDFLFVLREMKDEKITIITPDFKRIKRKRILVDKRIKATIRVIDLGNKRYEIYFELGNKQKFPVPNADRIEFENEDKMFLAMKKLEIKKLF